MYKQTVICLYLLPPPPPPHLQLAAVQLQQLFSVDVSCTEFWDVLIHVESLQPLTDLLSRPRGHEGGRLITGLEEERREDHHCQYLLVFSYLRFNSVSVILSVVI